MSFQFRFEKILTMKEKEKDSAVQEMTIFKRMKENAEQQLLELVEKKESYIKDYHHLLRNSLRVTDIQEREHYIHYLNQQIEKFRKKVIDLTKEFNLKNNHLLAKNQEEKMWSSWREKSFEAYSEKINREEQHLLDEMAIIRYFHNQNQQSY
ncbi:flagellar biosynthesis chaperone [Neobacillus bataviensis LMG 21833]|uniref:Flagellar FliJ protein n=1 Tax=Neobacillus bataviensis LMG 21833 TaxID=1117379 RepID=K6DSB6_9BACI|nr:flagellar export protein FliJ [Neobacillus bataviensis]EKN63681.1 flagellar biosynthesis chaperone [Neobacillus bataviensis LMG 21833]